MTPLVVHVLYRLDTGGLENGVVNLINRMPADEFRHCVVSLTDATAFAARIRRPDVEVVALHKPPGHAVSLYPTLWRLFRERRPTIVHTRNLAALEAQVAAWAARVPIRLHGEHGRDVDDLDGNNPKLQRIRRLYSPFVHRYVALSQDLERYLVQRVGIAPERVTQIYNGVDEERFSPADGHTVPLPGCPFDPARHWIIGTVGRMQAVKNQTLLVEAFTRLLQRQHTLRSRLRLVLVGDGELRERCCEHLQRAGMADLAWLPGERSDIPEVMRAMHVFVLPSLAEGISNTILEAMACGLPVVATRVGGNPELVDDGHTGRIVPSGDASALADALEWLAHEPQAAAQMGVQGRALVQARFGLQSMVQAYRRLYRCEAPA